MLWLTHHRPRDCSPLPQWTRLRTSACCCACSTCSTLCEPFLPPHRAQFGELTQSVRCKVTCIVARRCYAHHQSSHYQCALYTLSEHDLVANRFLPSCDVEEVKSQLWRHLTLVAAELPAGAPFPTIIVPVFSTQFGYPVILPVLLSAEGAG